MSAKRKLPGRALSFLLAPILIVIDILLLGAGLNWGAGAAPGTLLVVSGSVGLLLALAASAQGILLVRAARRVSSGSVDTQVTAWVLVAIMLLGLVVYIGAVLSVIEKAEAFSIVMSGIIMFFHLGICYEVSLNALRLSRGAPLQ